MIDTEAINPKSRHIGEMSTLEAVKLMQEENHNAVRALENALPQIAKVIDKTAERLKNGGRLLYIGCGTSGRIGVLDASECPPTFGVPESLVVGIIAGGDTALRHAVEGAEDSAEKGEQAVLDNAVTAKDTVVGISAAGGAAFVVGALQKARAIGAFTVALSSARQGRIQQIADVAILTQTGAEVIAGSTRMKAGTAQKLVLNMISTGVMIRLGYVYENRMINLKPSNLKLKKRMEGIVQDILGVDEKTAALLLENTHYVIRDAISLYRGGQE